MKRVGLAALIETIEKSGFVNLTEILQCRIMEESLSVFKANGIFRKIQKNELIRKLNLVLVDSKVYEAINLVGFCLEDHQSRYFETPDSHEKYHGEQSLQFSQKR